MGQFHSNEETFTSWLKKWGQIFEMKGTKVIRPGYLLTSLTCKRGSMSGGSLVLAGTAGTQPCQATRDANKCARL